MDSSSSPLSEELFQCSICLKMLTEPVSVPCGHNFCTSCMRKYWEGSIQHQCPVYKGTFNNSPDLSVNTFITEVATFVKQLVAAERMPSVRSHQQQCAEVGEVACDVCTGRKLKAVKSCPVCLTSYCEPHLEPHPHVASFEKHKLIKPAEALKDQMCKIHERRMEFFCKTCVCLFCTKTDHKTYKTPKAVPTQEEHGRETNELWKTKNQVPKMIEVCGRRGVSTLRRLMSRLEEILGEKLQKLCDAELKAVKKFAVDVTLDPDTANSKLELSDDGKQVTLRPDQQNLPVHLKRFDTVACVLGGDGLLSGRGYYEVQVNGKTGWAVGVVRESVNRKGCITLSPANGHWTLGLMDADEYVAHAGPCVLLAPRKKPQKVGVFVDYEEGRVSFYDVQARSHMYSFTGCTFTEKIYPFFYLGLRNEGQNYSPLIIC